MNPWFDLLSDATTFEFIPPGVMLQRTLTHLQEQQVFWGWDDPTHFQRRNIKKLRLAIGSRLDLGTIPITRVDKRITVLVRKDATDFFDKDAEVLGSGAAARSIGNLYQIGGAIGNLLSLDFLDTASLTPAKQINALWRLCASEWGAGVSQLGWGVDPGACAVGKRMP